MACTLATLETPPNTGAAVEEACRRIAPLWPLQSFVAVNPFLGLSGMPFREAAQLLEKVAHQTPLMDGDYYVSRMQDGTIAAADVRAALTQCESGLNPLDPISWLTQALQQSHHAPRLLTVADWLDATRGTGWAAFVVDEISKWCSSYFDRGQSAWHMPWKDLPLYQAWKRAAALDANPEVFGLSGFRQYVRQLPESADAAIDHTLDRLNIPAEQTAAYLHRVLVSINGWSAYAAYQDRQAGGEPSALRQLLAIRLAYDTALLGFAGGDWRCESTHRARTGTGLPEAKHIAQAALEHAFQARLIGRLRHAQPAPAPSARKALQAVFCIDVRSEVYRRALEAQSADIETIGFAGFFGMPVEFASTARCPVLIAPKHQVQAAPVRSRLGEFGGQLASAWKNLRHSPAAAFPSVEVCGAWFGLRILRQLRSAAVSELEAAEPLHWSIPLTERIDLAAGALKNMSLDARRLAPVVLLCGHGSRTENNPYGASLDCGACGGHKGDVNARFAAALLNDPAVRRGLAQRDMTIPGDTVFIAGLHITTTDDVILYDAESLLTEQQRADVQSWLRAASHQARRDRGDAGPAASFAKLAKEAQQRSADWSEVRPEWGLAGNAAFIAAPRSRTRGLDLGGRVFLHEYDAAADHDASVLQLILTAPVVVASWINLQYFGSTVDNRLYGSGNKVLHNVVGTFGVWEGNGGDLRTGLPLQSLHDGARWVHEPLRLQVVIESPRERIDMVLRANPDVRNLVENQWIHLLAIEESSVYQRRGGGMWQGLGAMQASER